MKGETSKPWDTQWVTALGGTELKQTRLCGGANIGRAMVSQRLPIALL